MSARAERDCGLRGTWGFWRAPLLMALAEAVVFAVLMLIGLLLQEGVLANNVISQGIMCLGPLSGAWLALRLRPVSRQGLLWLLRDLAAAAALSVLLPAAAVLILGALGLGEALAVVGLGVGNILIMCLSSGPSFLFVRVVGRFWRKWQYLRRTRLVWGLTHSILVTVLCLMAPLALLYAVYIEVGAIGRLIAENPPTFWVAVLSNLLMTIVPAVAVTLAMVALALGMLSVPVGFFSFLAARRVTRRMETLAAATGSLRRGDYGARAVVQGEDEVAQLQRDFNAMADELERTLDDLRRERDRVAALLASRRTLLSGVSHELRTPVATLRGYVEPLLEGGEGNPPLSEPVRHDLEVMAGEIVRLQGLIDDLFTLARSEEGALALDCRPVALRPLIRDVADALAPLAWNSGRVEVAVIAAEDGAELWAVADEGRLQQVLLNLVRNGIRHTPPGGIVALAAGVFDDCDAGLGDGDSDGAGVGRIPDGGETVTLTVRDTGEGIAAEDLPFIFDRFYRGENGWRRDVNGAGLGLALAKELVEAMGGAIAVESKAGEGTCFRVTLRATTGPPAD